MSVQNKSAPLKRLEGIFEKQQQAYQARKQDFENMWDQAIKEDLPRVKASDTKLFRIKWISISAVIGFIIYGVFL